MFHLGELSMDSWDSLRSENLEPKVWGVAETADASAGAAATVDPDAASIDAAIAAAAGEEGSAVAAAEASNESAASGEARGGGGGGGGGGRSNVRKVEKKI